MSIKNNEDILQNKKVIVRSFDKDRPFYPKGHDGRVRFTGCKVHYCLPYKMTSRSYANIFEDGEQSAFEALLGLEKNALNIRDFKSKWWTGFTVELTKEDKELDLSNPMHLLEYKVLMANSSKVAKSKDKYNGSQLFYIVDEELENQERYNISEKTKDAFEAFFKISKNNKKMYNVIRIMGIRLPKEASGNKQELETILMKAIEQKTPIKGTPDINDFLSAANDPLFEEKVFVIDAMEIGEVKRDGRIYKIEETGVPVGGSIEECALFFKDVKNQNEKLIIEERIKRNK